MKRDVVFLGDVSMGGRRYEAGVSYSMRPQDVQALIDSGSARWADEAATPTTSSPPRIWRMTVPVAMGDIRLETSTARLRRWHAEERRNPRHEDGRTGVLNAIEEQLGQLGVDDPNLSFARGA